MRFRTHYVALTGDIAKMYRQIIVEPNDSPAALCLRDDPSKPFKFFKLLTVTYGTAPAPYLATRILKELALLHQVKFP